MTKNRSFSSGKPAVFKKQMFLLLKVSLQVFLKRKQLSGTSFREGVKLLGLLTRIRGFIEVVEAGGFSAAARKTHKSKALLSKHVHELEDELGAVLLNRTDNPPIIFNRSGSCLLSSCFGDYQRT